MRQLIQPNDMGRPSLINVAVSKIGRHTPVQDSRDRALQPHPRAAVVWVFLIGLREAPDQGRTRAAAAERNVHVRSDLRVVLVDPFLSGSAPETVLRSPEPLREARVKLIPQARVETGTEAPGSVVEAGPEGGLQDARPGQSRGHKVRSHVFDHGQRLRHARHSRRKGGRRRPPKTETADAHTEAAL